MRLYHFINEQYGLQALLKKCLKLARISQLNDPFDMMGVDLSNADFRQAMEKEARYSDEKYGILCFSEIWDNPVLWAHYAGNHKGLCLGFDISVDREGLAKMVYRKKPISADKYVSAIHALHKKSEVERKDFLESREWQKFMDKFMSETLRTKFSHWSYEKEWRIFLDLNKLSKETNGLYYLSFNESLKLKEVIIGLRSNLTPEEIKDTFRVPDVFKVRKHDSKFAMIKDEINTL